MKRSHEELTRASRSLDLHISTLSKKRRQLDKELADSPDEQQRLATERAKLLRAKRDMLLETLPYALVDLLTDDAGRKNFPVFGALVSLDLEVDTFNVKRLKWVDVVRISIQFEKASRFEGVLFPDSEESLPAVNWDVDDKDEEKFYQDPWQCVFKANRSNPVYAIYALLVRGLVLLEREGESLTSKDSAVARLKKVWECVYPENE